MRRRPLALTYDECRARFHRAAVEAGVGVRSEPIDARGPDGQRLTVDWVALGSPRPRRALLVLSGVHGVEGFAHSQAQCELLGRVAPGSLPDDVAVVVVHAVNPWGMAWWRRQNESNVDLNRNWRRSEREPVHNDAYDEVHHLACPDAAELPDVEALLGAAAELVAERGLPWVRDAITKGQYRHPDGLHYGGDRTEASTAIVERLARDHLTGVERLLTLDLHTGHGPSGELVLLSDQPPGSPQDRFLSRLGRVEATADNPDATTGTKSGQIGNGLAELFPDATCYATSAELGTAGDLEQLAATYQESWVHRRGDRSRPEHAAVVWAYRCCFTPDDAGWEQAALRLDEALLDDALAAVVEWAG